MTVNSFAKGSGVNHQILQRIIDGEATKQTTLDKLGVYIIENKL